MICCLSMSGDVLVDGGGIGTTIRGLDEKRRFYNRFGVFGLIVYSDKLKPLSRTYSSSFTEI
ncbi:MAG: hypothetical protein LCH34_10380 [Firmicutes bacterium]|nr:hypothetical protein [Bacillota bacterium]